MAQILGQCVTHAYMLLCRQSELCRSRSHFRSMLRRRGRNHMPQLCVDTCSRMSASVMTARACDSLSQALRYSLQIGSRMRSHTFTPLVQLPVDDVLSHIRACLCAEPQCDRLEMLLRQCLRDRRAQGESRMGRLRQARALLANCLLLPCCRTPAHFRWRHLVTLRQTARFVSCRSTSWSRKFPVRQTLLFHCLPVVHIGSVCHHGNVCLLL